MVWGDAGRIARRMAGMLGSPLPGDMVRATHASEIQVAWRRWITMRVKVIDEYT